MHMKFRKTMPIHHHIEKVSNCLIMRLRKETIKTWNTALQRNVSSYHKSQSLEWHLKNILKFTCRKLLKFRSIVCKWANCPTTKWCNYTKSVDCVRTLFKSIIRFTEYQTLV